mmetsp:Transcript_24479/g.84034  ORF Transcript_24479/g.84034 Transcript_24479/m.84034 type:complete len:294 (+) Transcript_24479:1410-2291(+)
MEMNIWRRFSSCSRSLSFAGGAVSGSPNAARRPRARRRSLSSSPSGTLASLGSFETFVSPSTMARTSAPNVASISSSVTAVSSTVSWRRPAATVSRSMPRPQSRPATATGWTMKGSPERRIWPACAPCATRSASWTNDSASCDLRYAHRFLSSAQSRATARSSARAARSLRLRMRSAVTLPASFCSRSLVPRCAAAQSSRSSRRFQRLRRGRPRPPRNRPRSVDATSKSKTSGASSGKRRRTVARRGARRIEAGRNVEVLATSRAARSVVFGPARARRGAEGLARPPRSAPRF